MRPETIIYMLYIYTYIYIRLRGGFGRSQNRGFLRVHDQGIGASLCWPVEAKGAQSKTMYTRHCVRKQGIKKKAVLEEQCLQRRVCYAQALHTLVGGALVAER